MEVVLRQGAATWWLTGEETKALEEEKRRRYIGDTFSPG
jgi:hypothetical protein